MKLVKIIFLILLVFQSTVSFAQQQKIHRVKSGETLRSIAKKYSITPYELVKINPDIKNPPETGKQIVIPVSDVYDITVESKVVDKNINGIIYHTVQPKETLYSLSKKYNVEIKQFYENNPTLIDGLKIGMVLSVEPVKSVNEVVEKEVATIDVSKFIVHKVNEKETIWSLCHRYGITEPELLSSNPDVALHFNVGDTIYIPKNQLGKEVKVDDLNKNFVYHDVKPKETLYSISKRYGVTKDELTAQNPILKGGLEIGQVLKVENTVNLIHDTIKYKTETLTNRLDDELLTDRQKISFIDKLKINQVIDVALILPLYVEKNKSKLFKEVDVVDDVDDLEKSTEENFEYVKNRVYGMSSIGFDFYNGALMAMDSLRKSGLSIRLRVFDSEKDLKSVQRILDENDLTDMDVVIGPLYAENVEYVADRLKYDNVLVVSPLSKKHNLDTRFNLVQAMPTTFITKNSVLEKILSENKNNINVMVFGGILDASQVDFIEDRLVSKLDSNSVKVYLSPDNLVSKEKINLMVEKNKINIAVIGSTNEVLVTDVVTGMYQTVDVNATDEKSENLKPKVFLLSNPKVLNQIGSDYLNALSLSYPEDYFLDYQKPLTQKFDDDFKLKNSYYPSKYSYRGFDVTYNTLLLISGASNLEVGLLNNPMRHIQGKFNYARKPYGGYYNKGVFIIKYKDWKLVESN
ncbi:MAG: LysM peptidoglycan-binding domain-containing protein [Ichthyobacteriaceae bacterium]|nr:LysM peptidoglycan-binding domain-containing protein [Ichthyobacteriaceae bacterium]